MNNQSESSQFSEDYRETSYWLDDISSFDSENEKWPELPEQTDLVIIGSGYTGLNAAIETAAQGVETLVIDQGDLGQGCRFRVVWLRPRHRQSLPPVACTNG